MNRHRERYIDISVGFFMLLGVVALAVMVMKVSGITNLSASHRYQVIADFTDIGGLKVRAPVTIAGVIVGEVTDISLQNGELTARVIMMLDSRISIPYEDVSARILTQGLLGSNYISIVPGFEGNDKTHPYLRAGDVIAKTQEAIILENLIGQLLFNIKK
jgi:phospholipid/cholesterol/gamma-HCH transport system substrate-binding protein